MVFYTAFIQEGVKIKSDDLGLSHSTEGGLKNNKYLFDWSKSSINKINSVLRNNFNLFDKVKINKLSSNHLYKFQKNISSYIVSNIYNISFAHELINNSNNDIQLFQNELLNRINTFKSKKDNYIIFVLFNLQKSNNISILINSLSHYFNNFKLLYISNYISISDLLNTNIIYVNINIIYKDWMYSNLDWFNIIYDNL